MYGMQFDAVQNLGLTPACLQSSLAVILCVAFDRDYFCAIGVNGVVRTLSEEIETMLFQVSNEITSFDRHAQPQWAVAQLGHCQLEFPFRFADRRAPFH